jgi:isoamylase
MILDSLHYWVEDMHLDGFRFDLASILERDESGNMMPNPAVLWVSTQTRRWRALS